MSYCLSMKTMKTGQMPVALASLDQVSSYTNRGDYPVVLMSAEVGKEL